MSLQRIEQCDYLLAVNTLLIPYIMIAYGIFNWLLPTVSNCHNDCLLAVDATTALYTP